MARRRESGVVRLEGFCTIFVRLEGFSIIFFKWEGTRMKNWTTKARRHKGFDTNCTNFHCFFNHRWTRIKNNDFDANFANYHEFFQSYGIDRLTSAINREFFVNRIDHYGWTRIKIEDGRLRMADGTALRWKP
jgi:hypothetical protein